MKRATLAQPLIGCIQHDCAECAQRDKARRKVQIITDVIEMVDNRCLEADGPVSRTREEITDEEMRRIYKAAKAALRFLNTRNGKSGFQR